MPDEPNKRMDELLKSYAKKRREEAGAPLEMHPATRKMLQAEVAKLAEQAEETTAESQLWTTLLRQARPVLAVGAVVAVLVVIGIVWVQLRAPSPMEMAKNEERAQASATASVDGTGVESGGTTLELQMDQLEAVPEKKVAELNDDLAPAPASDVRGALPTLRGSLQRPEPEVAKSDANGNALGNGSVFGMADKDAAAAEGEKLAFKSATRPASPAPTAPPPLAAPSEEQGELIAGFSRLDAPRQAAGQRFNRVGPRAAAAAGKESAGFENVLNSFTLAQEGDRVFIRDEDGSTYEGRIIAAPRDSARMEEKAKRELGASEAKTAAAARTRQAGEQANITNFFFVTGTNLNLNKVVVFEGNFLIAPQSAATLGTADLSGEKQGIDSRIQGRARIGGGNEIQIEAVPVGQIPPQNR